MNDSLILLLLLSFVVGCSPSSKTETQFFMTRADLTSAQSFSGGVFLKATRTTEEGKVVEYFDVPSNFQVALTSGTYELQFVNYLGPSAWSGQMYCGSLPNAVIQGESVTLDIVLSRARCVEDAFVAMDQIKNPKALWGVAVWGQGKWSP